MTLLHLLLIPLTILSLARADSVPPISPALVDRPFDYLDAPWDAGHRGVDLLGTTGMTIRSARDGTVIYAGTLVDRSVISIEHPDGLRSTYLPVIPTVTVGDEVEAGDPIGTLDGSHCGYPCLHWGLKRGDVYYDPMSLLQPVQVRLYPPED